jgi:hypothetical protein
MEAAVGERFRNGSQISLALVFLARDQRLVFLVGPETILPRSREGAV